MKIREVLLNFEERMNLLTYRQKQIYIDYYGINKYKSLCRSQIAKKYGISKTRVQQLLNKAIGKMNRKIACKKMIKEDT